MDKKYKYVGYFLLLFIPLVFSGFYKSYFEPFPNFQDNITVTSHLHAFMAGIWVLLLITQPFLIYNKQIALHHKLGKLSYVIFPLLILSLVPSIIKILASQNITGLFFPVADGTLLIVFYSLAIYNRKNSDKHMRYIIASALVLLGPTVGRIGPILLGWTELFTQNTQYAIIYSILVSLILYDIKNERKFQPYLFAIACFAVHQLVFYSVFT